MAAVTRVTPVSPATAPPSETDRVPCQKAAAAIVGGDFCSLGAGGWTPTSTMAPGVLMAAQDAKVGEPVTMWRPGMRIRYAAPSGSGLTPGALLYLSAGTAGALDTTATGTQAARCLANSQGVFEGVIELL